MVKKGSVLSEEHRQKLRAAALGRKHSEETKKKMSEAHKAENLSPETRAKIRAGVSGENNGFYGRHHTEESKYIMGLNRAGKGMHKKTEEAKRKIGDAHVGKKLTDDQKQHLRELRTGSKHSPETRFKMAEAHAGEKSHLWKGGKSFEPYCKKFNNGFKERVRAFFGYKCALCGMSQQENGRKLDVHHVNYNKNSCCDTDVPPLFAALCFGCHTNTTNGDRDQYEQKLVEIINTQFVGKCFFTKNEYLEYLKTV